MPKTIHSKDYIVSNFLLFSSAAYLAGVFVESFRQRKTGRLMRGIIPLLIGICLAAVAYSASATAQYASAAVLYLVFFDVAVPLSIYGLGMLLTSVASFLPSHRLGRCIKVGLIAAPIVLAAFLKYETAQRHDAHQQQEAEAQASFQMTNVEGTLSGISVELPASPQIDLYHDCNNTVPRSRRTCRTYFPTAVRLRVEDQLSTPVAFKQVLINPTNGAAASWCDRRPDMSNRIWCSDVLGYPIRLADSPVQAPSGNSWEEILDTPGGLRIWCQKGSQGSICQSHYIVAPDVFARGWFTDVNMNQIVPIAVAQQRISDLIWQDISHRP